MENRYRKYRRRNGIYYCEDLETGKQQSLGIRDSDEADTLVSARNGATRNQLLNRELARVYSMGADPKMATRRWEEVMAAYVAKGNRKSTVERARAFDSKAFESLKSRLLAETTAEHFHTVLQAGGNSANHYLRRLHNYACGMGWLLGPVFPPKLWPATESKEMRAVTLEEHERIVAAEGNPERRMYYEMLWQTGGSQSDIAELTVANIDQIQCVLSYNRQKLKPEAPPCCLQIGDGLQALLDSLPKDAHLFPRIAASDARARSTEFSRRCRLLGIKGISLHSYRYAWAQRAKRVGMPERFAMQALGHSSKAVHRAYSGGENVAVPSLEVYESEAVAKNEKALSASPPSPAASVLHGNGTEGKLVFLISKLIAEAPEGMAALRTIFDSTHGENVNAA